jgi:hypothetical protein
VTGEEGGKGFFFHDVPMGVRLFNAYKSGYNHRK